MKSTSEKKENKKIGIVFVSYHWGKHYGGIDTFNQDICEAMAYVVDREKISVICLVFESVPDDVVEDAFKKGVIIVPYTSSSKKINLKILNSARKKVYLEAPSIKYIWIGHDIITGDQAVDLASIEDEKCAVVFHSSYDYIYRDNPNNELRKEKNENTIHQKQLAQKVDWTFCVGPIVHEFFKKI